MSKLPTQRTLEFCRNQGLLIDVVERWISFGSGSGGIRKDLFGFIDLVAIEPGQPGVLGIQCTSGSGMSARQAKLQDEHDISLNMEAWLQAGNRLQIWGWRKLKVKRGGKAVRWKPRIIHVHLHPLYGTFSFEDERNPLSAQAKGAL